MGAERRQLTVLSCQRINSADSDALDAEELYQIEQAFRHWCLECLIPLGAYLAQTLRDGLVFYFGYPQAQEDSARRAVLAGLQLLDKVPQTPAASTPAGPLQVRMGIHTGVIIVEPFEQQSSPRALLTSGPTELIAMQLSQQAPAQRVVISETTARLVAGYFDWQPLPSVPPAPAAYLVFLSVALVGGALILVSRLLPRREPAVPPDAEAGPGQPTSAAG
jgi:class 3 adenylate cyclase